MVLRAFVRVAKRTCKWFQRAARPNVVAGFVEPCVVNGGEMFPDEWVGAAVGGGQQVWFMEESEAGDSAEPLQMFTCGLSAQWESRLVFTRDSQDVVPFHRNITDGNKRLSAGVFLFVHTLKTNICTETKTPPNLIYNTHWFYFTYLSCLREWEITKVWTELESWIEVFLLQKNKDILGFCLWII